jgi:hypothetical protein
MTQVSLNLYDKAYEVRGWIVVDPAAFGNDDQRLLFAAAMEKAGALKKSLPVDGIPNAIATFKNKGLPKLAGGEYYQAQGELAKNFFLEVCRQVSQNVHDGLLYLMDNDQPFYSAGTVKEIKEMVAHLQQLQSSLFYSMVYDTKHVNNLIWSWGVSDVVPSKVCGNVLKIQNSQHFQGSTDEETVLNILSSINEHYNQ